MSPSKIFLVGCRVFLSGTSAAFNHSGDFSQCERVPIKLKGYFQCRLSLETGITADVLPEQEQQKL